MLPCIFGVAGPTLAPDERDLFRDAQPAGFILFGRNCVDKAQLRALTDALRSITGRGDLPILIDQEGGRVARLRAPGWPDFPPQARFGDLYERAPISGMEAARVNALAIALVLAEVGVNVATSPLLDLRHPETHEVIGERALGSDPLQVASLGRMVLDGLAAGGVAGIVKHMPGHGRARADSHEELPVVEADEEALEADLAPFQSLAGRARIGMTAHILYPAWDPERCATLSPTIIGEVIRERIGFSGLLLSDDIAMAALSGGLGERASAALAAGCDLVLFGSGDLGENVRLAEALPPVSAPALERLQVAMALPAPEEAPDLAALIARRDTLLAQIVSQARQA